MKTFSDSFRKNLYACLFGPLAIIPASILYALFFKFYEPSANADNFQIVPLFIFIGLIVAYPLTIFLGFPLSLALQKYNKFRLRHLSLIVVIGAILSIVITGGGIPDFLFVFYFSIFVSTFCWYLHKVG